MRIFLIGFMGSGKTTVGNALARKLNFSFIDLDSYIENKTGKSIFDIFADEGEEKFRKEEHKALIELCKKDNIVISCGGGTPCFYNNIDIINKKGVSVYIKYPIGKLKTRLLPNIGKRPMLKNIFTPEDLESFIRIKLEERENFYLKSKLVLTNPKGTKDIIALVTDFLKDC
jgi:shikimate kinase